MIPRGTWRCKKNAYWRRILLARPGKESTTIYLTFLCKSCQLKLESLTLGDPILVCAECIQRQKTCRILEHRETHLQDLLVAAEKDRDLWRKRYNILYEEYKPLYEEYLKLKADPEGFEEIISKNERHDDGSHGGI